MTLRVIFSLSLLAVGLLCQEEENGKPVHYCFVDPPVKFRLPPNILENITTCTHLVYGKVPIDNDSGYPEYSVTDVSQGYDIDNIRTFLRMRQYHPNAKFLIGLVRSAAFEHQVYARKTAKALLTHIKRKRFDGIFVAFDGIHLEYLSSVAFLEELAKEKSMMLTFSLSGARVFAREAVLRLQAINPLVSHIYLDMGELPSNEEPSRITQINPLFSNTSIPFEETIQGTVDELTKEGGILPSRIVVGLTAGGWKFTVKDDEDPLRVEHGMYAKEAGQRVAYQDACRARGAVIFDSRTMNELTLYRQSWMCVNLPTQNGMGAKLKWIIGQKFAGVGINDALTDDPRGECGTDALPAHRLAMELIHNIIPKNPAKCTRLCYLDPQQVEETFPIDNLKTHYCSHIVVHYFDLDLKKKVVVAEKAEELVKKIDEWRNKILEVAPKLILSVGSKQTTGVWQFLLGNDFHRKELVEELVKSVNASTADGLEISWTLEPMAHDFDKKNLKSLIDEVISAQTEASMDLLVAATPQSSYSNFYDYDHLNQTATLVVLHSHRLHSESVPFTGHPSPLHSTPSMKDPRMCWEALFNHWNDKVSRNKLVLSLTASTLSMQSLSDMRSSASAPFGQPAYVSMLRSKKADIHSQQEICESLQAETGITHWVDEAEVPYLRRYDQMVAYEDTRSSHIKAVWASTEGVGGLALHEIHQDDPNAVCNNRTSFPLLDSLSRAQVCQNCLKQHDFKKCAQHDFVVSCNFELKRNTPLFKTDIVPYERCTEVVVQKATLGLEGNVTFKDSHEEQVLKNLTSMRPKMLKCGMVLSLHCGDSERHLNYILGDNMTVAIDNVMAMMDKYKFSGLQLDCEKPVRRGNHVFFNTFVRKLTKKIENTKASNGCNRTLSARFSPFTKTPSSYYSANLLNKMSHVSIRMTDKIHVDLPFFSNTSRPDFPSTEKFVDIWKKFGLKPEKLVLELSPFGWQDGKAGGEKKRMSQGESCVTVGNKANFRHDYETLTGYTTHSNGTVHVPMVEDFRYKIGYIQREQLGGLALNTVNGDDYTGICGRGSFPILKSVYSSVKCR